MDFGVLSTAHIGIDYVIPAIQASEHRVAAIASRDADRADDVAAETGIDRSYGSYEALLSDDGIDAVYNPLPNALHAEWTRKAADAGRHVLCEKPLTRDPGAANDLFDYCEERGVTLMEAFMYRFHPRTERALEIVREELGAVRHVEATFTFQMGDRTDNFRLDPDLDGGALMDVGCYAVSAARNFLGEPDRAYATAVDRYDSGVDSHLAGTLEYGDGPTAHVVGSFDAPHTERYRVLTEDGRVEAADPFGPEPDQPVSLTWVKDGEEHTETFDAVDHYRLQAEAFADAVDSGRTPRVDRAETVGNAAAIDALYESAERGESVAVDAE
ncbi:Gfo/Idh/MocA family protein [Halomicrobium urmianum]|uniref:Gfo/Idh/MocA family protein n=1 Tax=Halomicrobium urmianum TaxID=1586233 RepID=UPI001CD970BB|nr:Gfo/Idh/MocA family oxidoreductase [Halomicrobium urmianum]